MQIPYCSNLTVIQGENGSGKTTLVKLITGELEPTTGTIHRSWSQHEFGVIFQSAGLFPEISARENLDAAGIEGHLIDDLAKKWKITNQLETLVEQLSGGEERRLQGARLSGLQRQVWIIDEPTSAADSMTKDLFSDLICGALQDGRSVVVVSHDSAWVGGIEESAHELETAVTRVCLG